MSDDRVVWLIGLAAISFFVGMAIVLGVYGGLSFWPGLVSNFGASLGAFVLALSWDHRVERRRQAEAQTAEAKRAAMAEGAAHEQRVTEARRRFGPIAEELDRNKISLKALASAAAVSGTFPNKQVLHPELLDGAWSANAARLTQLIADYELISKLASTYGRIEELRWRLRERTRQMGIHVEVTAALSEMTVPLVDELVGEVDDLLARVKAQTTDPTVQPLGLISIK